MHRDLVFGTMEQWDINHYIVQEIGPY